MFIVYLLVISLVLLLAFSLSRETGKNTKYARKGTNAIALPRETTRSIDTSNIVEIN